MTFPTAEKGRIMGGSPPGAVKLYIAMGVGASDAQELQTSATSAADYCPGYSRGEVEIAESTTASGTGVVTIDSALTIYTPTAAGTPAPTHMRISRASTGTGMWVTDWVALGASVAAPARGQSVVTGTVTITP